MRFCVICEVREAKERHHLLPRARGGSGYRTIGVCRECGKGIHKTFKNKQLENNYNTISRLKEYYYDNGCQWKKGKDKKDKKIKEMLDYNDREIRRVMGWFEDNYGK